MSHLISLVYLYFAAAIGYNIASILCKDFMGKALAPTDPSAAVSLLSALILVYFGEASLAPTLRALLMLCFIFLILRFGIVRHYLNFSHEQYLSRTSWFLAIAINVYGVGVLSTAVFLNMA